MRINFTVLPGLLLIPALVFLLSGTAFGQGIPQSLRTDYDNIIPPDRDSASLSYEDKLVWVAWKNFPLNMQTNAKFRQAVELHKQARLSWLNQLSFSTQYYAQQTSATDPSGGSQSTFVTVPRVGLALTINVGGILSTPSRIRFAGQEKEVAQSNINTQKLFCRAETLRRYELYKMQGNLLRINMETVEDSHVTVTLLKHRFEMGEINIEDYTKILRAHNENQQLMLTTQANLAAAKLTLEEILGIPLEKIR
ncbi:MAG: TolC family protein [Bacteroidota bacterium]